MNGNQIDLVMKHRLPVMYAGRRYERIVELATWYDHRGKKSVRRLSAVLQDKGSTIKVSVNKVSLANKI